MRRDGAWVRINRLFRVTFSSAALLTAPAAADLVSPYGGETAPNFVEIHVLEDRVRVELEIDRADYPFFVTQDEGGGLSLAERSGRTFVVETSTETLEPQTRAVTLRRRKARPTAATSLAPLRPRSADVIFAALEFPFEQKPGTLIFSPPLDASGRPRASIGVLVTHLGVPVTDYRYLSQRETMLLDWVDPWFSRFENPNLTRHHKEARMAFLYAEPHEVRREALFRVRDALSMLGSKADGPELSADEAEALSAVLAETIAARTSMFVDGKPVQPDFDRAAQMRIGPRGLEYLQPGEPLDVNAGFIGLIWSAPVNELPQTAALEWSWFDGPNDRVSGHAVDAAGPFLFPLMPDDPRIEWVNRFKTPPYPPISAVAVERADTPAPLIAGLGAITLSGLIVVGLGALRPGIVARRAVLVVGAIALIGAAGVLLVRDRGAPPELDPDQLKTLAGDLLNNVYRAFDFRTEDQVYDRLALTLHGDVLEEVYLAQRDALRIERAGGADARVTALDVRSATLVSSERGELRFEADWRVSGQVGHWGHVHSRRNAYRAELVVAAVDGAWKILDFDVLRQERLQ